MLDKLEQKVAYFTQLEQQLSDPTIMSDMKRYKEISKEHAHLSHLVSLYSEYKKLLDEIKDSKALIDEDDEEISEMAKAELPLLQEKEEKIQQQLKIMLVPRDPMDSKNIIMEIRAGTGGDESALFSADLFRMYSRYAEMRKWKIEIMSANEIELGGFKEIIFSITGENVFETLKYESGVHRVQRVPATESGGRIHTSAATVAVLPEAEETDIEINPNDLKIDVFRSSGPGGQSVNTTDSAVRLTHIPTGMVVICQDEKSQIKNKAKALKVLRSRLYEIEEQKKQAQRADARKNQVGSGDRSERIRTYNFPQNRLTDHRINLTLYKLDQIMEGTLDELFDGLKLYMANEALQNS